MKEHKFFIRLMAGWVFITILILCCGAASYFIHQKITKIIDDTKKWKGFTETKLVNDRGIEAQKAYVYRGRAGGPLIISLHSWSASYQQRDIIANHVKDKGWSYIRPDFRGPNKNQEACGSDNVIHDIKDAINFGLNVFKAHPDSVYIVGGSGGGYTALMFLIKNPGIKVRKIIAINPITDLVAWKKQSEIRGKHFAEDIYNCTTNEGEEFNVSEAYNRSPLMLPLENNLFDNLEIYAGSYDGVVGPVPPTHSINFYNSIIKDAPEQYYVNNKELISVYTADSREHNTYIDNKFLILSKSYNNISLVIFAGGHEMLSPEFLISRIN